ncbi:MAG: hypothetical protein KAT14_04650 [Candidatus Marinimicrobia bacterium]|nr:hypothetical protein [Candidatus Neomarinimicrobiota bacterium]
MGEKVRVLVNENQNAGSYSLTWDGNNSIGNRMSSGIYFYRLEAEQFTAVKKMILIK